MTLDGLKELLEYIYTAKYEDNYIKKETKEDHKIAGFLLVNGWPFKIFPPFIEKAEGIAILDSQTIKTFDFLSELKLD